MKENYWHRQTAAYEDFVIDREFRTTMNQTLHLEDPDAEAI
ncbi:hypothetical protein [Corynebacterium marinum]|nr:hypothetical protein [Corynebacterium marinum]